MGDIPIKPEDGLKAPAVGDKSEHRTERKEIPIDKLSDREKQLLEEHKKAAEQGRVSVNFGNIEHIKIKLLENISIVNARILKQLIEMNYYLAKSVGENLDKPDFMAEVLGEKNKDDDKKTGAEV